MKKTGDADLLFDFCVSHAEGNDLHSDGKGHYDIGFTSFSRVFSPDTFCSVKTDESLRHRQEHELGVLPSNPKVPVVRKPILDLDPNPHGKYFKRRRACIAYMEHCSYHHSDFY